MRHQDANRVLWENNIFFFLAQHKEYTTRAYAFLSLSLYTPVAICYIGNLQERSCVNEATIGKHNSKKYKDKPPTVDRRRGPPRHRYHHQDSSAAFFSTPSSLSRMSSCLLLRLHKSQISTPKRLRMSLLKVIKEIFLMIREDDISLVSTAYYIYRIVVRFV